MPVLQPALEAGRIQQSEITTGKLPLELACMFAGCFLVYGALFGIGFLMYGQITKALIGFVLAAIASWILIKSWNQVKGID
jgi:large-conductance mechanosensitive channel